MDERSERVRRYAAAFVSVSVAVAGAWAALALGGRISYQVGAFEVEYFARLGTPVTEVALPPLGQIEAATHLSPVQLTATVQAIDPDLANETVRERGVPALVEDVERQGLAALRGYLVRALLIALLGSALAAIILHHHLREAAAVALAGWLVVVALGGLAYATYRPEAFLEPRYTGSLRLASRLVGPVRQATARLEDFRSELNRLVRGTVQAYGGLQLEQAPSGDAVVVVHISDLHGSPLGMDLAARLTESFDPDLVIDTGDITSFGTPLEDAILERIPSLEVPYVFVRGNHDTPQIGARIGVLPGATVLDGTTVEVEGLRIHGTPHPLFTPAPGFDLDDEEIAAAVREAGVALAEDLAGEEEPLDILAVHDDRVAEASAGLVPLVLSGHFHEFGETEREGTLFLRSASTGGGGLDTFTAVEPIPLGAEILYFEGTPPELVAFDRVSLDPETRDITVDRQLVEPAEPVPGPSPS
jgi:predicted phosphodiesterase